MQTETQIASRAIRPARPVAASHFRPGQALAANRRMQPCSGRYRGWGAPALALKTVLVVLLLFPLAARSNTITNLQQLTQGLDAHTKLTAAVDLNVTVCAASRPEVGVVIVRDASGYELLQLGARRQEFRPGDRLRLRQDAVLLRKRELGVQISAVPSIDLDGLHYRKQGTAELTLPAGRVPIRLEWFNHTGLAALDVLCNFTGRPEFIAPSNLWHEAENATAGPELKPGLRAEYFEGSWETVPDFDLLQPAHTGVVTNFNPNFRLRNERFGVRFSGFLTVPTTGPHQFETWSDDGSLLFINSQELVVQRLGRGLPPVPQDTTWSEQTFRHVTDRRWITLEGRASFISAAGAGVRFDLHSAHHVITVRVADATGLDLTSLREARVRVTGLARGGLTPDESLLLSQLFAANAASVVLLQPQSQGGTQTVPLTSVAEVQNLPIESARQGLPVRIRGTVTGAYLTSFQRWMSFQDDTRGIFVRLNALTNLAPAVGEVWEVEGQTGAGDFAPILMAQQMTRLGDGLLPPPFQPTWTELLNSSRDVTWSELKGLVTEVRSNTISLHLPEGQIEVEFDGLVASDLRPYLRAVVRIRGVLYAVWDAATREMRVGRVMMRNSVISVETPPPADEFDAVVRTPRELLRFDAQASAFRPVKVRGQIAYADASQIYLQADGTGLRLIPTERTPVSPGDLVEAVGYPNISRNELVLRGVMLRRTGTAPLPPAIKLDEIALPLANLNSPRVRVDGRLLGWHLEESGPVLEMQSGTRLYLARIALGKNTPITLRPGSRLALEGVYVGQGMSQNANGQNESFELLLNSLQDVTVVSQPSWWTLPRLLALLGLLLVILVFTVIWNTQLRRLVEQRTTQLEAEIRERERLERQNALESERARIARDLHDDLGSSLTEISVLASTGQLPQAETGTQQGLFQSISSRARSLIAALDVIVWAVDPEDNSLQSLADYLTGYTAEFFTHTPIACRFKVPVSFPAITLEGRVRHDLLMAVKEALNNVLRHADASELELRLEIVAQHLEIDIADNGKGIALDASSSGHGLKNLSARLRQLGGDCTIEPRAPGGTIVKIRLPLAGGVAHTAQSGRNN